MFSMENWKILCKKMWQLPPDSMKNLCMCNLQEQKNYSLFGLKICTGRLHQIFS